LTTTARRDVDYWGASAEARFGKAPAPVPDQGGYLFRLAYVGLGSDVRGIHQDNELRLRGDNSPVNYSETLDTTYAGAFLSVGGDYNLLGYLGIGGSWGIRSLLSLRGGLYNASTDYDGRFSARETTTRLGLSNDELAFIGAASFETRKQFGRRTSLSLVTDYEWYSFAPKMKYVNADRNGCSEVEDGPLFNCPGTVNRTHISDDDAFEVRTTLRLNIALGAAGLYAEPIKWRRRFASPQHLREQRLHVLGQLTSDLVDLAGCDRVGDRVAHRLERRRRAARIDPEHGGKLGLDRLGGDVAVGTVEALRKFRLQHRWQLRDEMMRLLR
jgi:hypothetical protein